MFVTSQWPVLLYSKVAVGQEPETLDGTAMLQGGSARYAKCGALPASLVKRMKERQQAKIAELRDALIESGCRTVFEQARALGLSGALLGRC